MAASTSTSPQGMLCALLMLTQIAQNFLDPSPTQENGHVSLSHKRRCNETFEDAEAAASSSCVKIWPSGLEYNTKYHHLLNTTFYDSKTFERSVGELFGFCDDNLKSRIRKENEKDEGLSQICYNYTRNGRSVYHNCQHNNIFLMKKSAKDLGINETIIQIKSLIDKYNESWFIEPRYTTKDWLRAHKLKLKGLCFEDLEYDGCFYHGWIRTPLEYLVNPRVRKGRYLLENEPVSSSLRGRGEPWHSSTFGRKSLMRHPRTAAWVSRIRRRSLDAPQDATKQRDSFTSPPFSEHHTMRKQHNVRVLYNPQPDDERVSKEVSCPRVSSQETRTPSMSRVPTPSPPRPELAIVRRLRKVFNRNTTAKYLNRLRNESLVPMEDSRFLYKEGGYGIGNGFSVRNRITPFQEESILSSHVLGIRNLFSHNRLISPLPEYPFHLFGVELNDPLYSKYGIELNDPLYSKYKKKFFEGSIPKPTQNLFSSSDSSAKSKRRDAIEKARREYGFYRSVPTKDYFDRRWPRNPRYREDNSIKLDNSQGDSQRDTSSAGTSTPSTPVCQGDPRVEEREKVIEPESPFSAYTQSVGEEEGGEVEYFTCIRVTQPEDFPNECFAVSKPQYESKPRSCPFLSGQEGVEQSGGERTDQWKQDILESTKRDYAFYDQLDFSKYIDPNYPRNLNFQFDFPPFDNYIGKEKHQEEYEERMEKMKTRDYFKENIEPVESATGISDEERKSDKEKRDQEETICSFVRAAIREHYDRASSNNCPYLTGHLPSGCCSKGICRASNNPIAEERVRGASCENRQHMDSLFVGDPRRTPEGRECTIAKEKVKNRFEFHPTMPLLKPLTVLDSTCGKGKRLKKAMNPCCQCVTPNVEMDCRDKDYVEDWEHDELIRFLISDSYFEDGSEERLKDTRRGDPYFKNEFDNMKGIYAKDGKSMRKTNFHTDSSKCNCKRNNFWMVTEDGKKYICTRKTKPSPTS